MPLRMDCRGAGALARQVEAAAPVRVDAAGQGQCAPLSWETHPLLTGESFRTRAGQPWSPTRLRVHARTRDRAARSPLLADAAAAESQGPSRPAFPPRHARPRVRARRAPQLERAVPASAVKSQATA